VDRVAAEVPGTLLLAEAFWLMEGYFVRTLGMHRVYNSAFMNMLRDEKNAEYRSVIKNTLEFDPDIMKRYVNFMSNPDERTAIDQFGTGDKCFGVAAMMATLPGLPMFGHGQIEGFTEKYGMEYQRPRYEENANQWLVERHQREIAPLLKRRWLFAESSNFLLYDFFRGDGRVEENVYAYSNHVGNERAVVVFNNRYGTAHGTIDFSAAYADKGAGGVRQRRLREGLDFNGGAGKVLAYRDSLTGLEYLRRADDLCNHGLRLELHAYQCHVFLDWRELASTAERPWDRLCDELGGRGVPNLDDALVMLELRPVHDALRDQLDQHVVRMFADLAEHPRAAGPVADGTGVKQRDEVLGEAWSRTQRLMLAAQHAWRGGVGDGRGSGATARMQDPPSMAKPAKERLRAAMRIPALEGLSPAPWSGAARRVLPSPSPQRTATAMWGPVLAWAALEVLAESIDPDMPEPVALDLFDRLRLREPFAHAFANLGFEGEESWRAAARIRVVLLTEAARARERVLVAPAELLSTPEEKTARGEIADRPGLPAELWHDPDVRWLTGAHEAGKHTYIIREPYEELLWWMRMPSLLKTAAEPAPKRSDVDAMSRSVREAMDAAEAAGYRVDLLIDPTAAARENDAAAEIEAQALEEEDYEEKPQIENRTFAESTHAKEPVEPKV